jgi:hypothetical protein
MRQAKLGEAHSENRVLVPEGFRLGEDNVWKWHAIGVVDNEGYVIFAGKGAEFFNFRIG